MTMSGNVIKRPRGRSVPCDYSSREHRTQRSSMNTHLEKDTTKADTAWEGKHYLCQRSNSFTKSYSCPISMEEELETQARASLALFGFGSSNDAINWKPISNGEIGHKIAANGCRLTSVKHRTCALNGDISLWNSFNTLELSGTQKSGKNATLKAINEAFKADNQVGISSSGGQSHEKAASKGGDQDYESNVLQQYFVKSAVLIPATLEEMVNLIITSEATDMEVTMQTLVGVKATQTKVLYRRNKKRPKHRSRNLVPEPTENPTGKAAEESPVSTSYYDQGSAALSKRPRASSETLSRHIVARDRILQRRKKLEKIHCKEVDTVSGYSGNLHVKWIQAEKSGRMFSTRLQYCLLDYDCIVINDWDPQDDGGPMYVRVMLSTQAPQFQAFTNRIAGVVKKSYLQPTGIMVREAKSRPGYIEVQFVASIIEKADMPHNLHRTKLRHLCLKIAKLEEILKSRHFAKKLTVQQQIGWIPNIDRLKCKNCCVKFTLSRRRHHCRVCGEVCCSNCCPKLEVELDSGIMGVRICLLCSKARRHRAGSSSSPHLMHRKSLASDHSIRRVSKDLSHEK
uniref:Uncharacterized protein AlNc14C56G4259 n=1 Tax=Albugo laibachii Nc14 TaxID=890382 RepID=F0WC76_9STRA|nr:conserved hypothetical protein [Albugo laibachii Nc14]|eukprot:CCA18789.1 conserved hypothetical protein [Albugo laibachii Nc14]